MPCPCHWAIPSSTRANSSAEIAAGGWCATNQQLSATKTSNRSPAKICGLPKRSRLKKVPTGKRVFYHVEAPFAKSWHFNIGMIMEEPNIDPNAHELDERRDEPAPTPRFNTFLPWFKSRGGIPALQFLPFYLAGGIVLFLFLWIVTSYLLPPRLRAARLEITDCPNDKPLANSFGQARSGEWLHFRSYSL